MKDRYGQEAVELTLDAAHALMNQGVSRNLKLRARDPAKREFQREMARREYEEQTYDVLSRTLPEINRGEPVSPSALAQVGSSAAEQRRLGLPEENLLYFLEKNAPKLADWQRELLRIVRNLSQYFLPAAPDEAHERRLRNVRALRNYEPACMSAVN